MPMSPTPVINFADGATEELAKDRVVLLLHHFSGLTDDRDPMFGCIPKKVIRA